MAFLDRVVCGGQTGADQAGWRAAEACGLPTGGIMPPQAWTEEGSRLDLAERYGAELLVMPFNPASHGLVAEAYKARTRLNVEKSDGTVWFGDPNSRGGGATLGACSTLCRPVLVVEAGVTKPSDMVAWIDAKGIRTLNVAGNRESKNPGIGGRFEAFLILVFTRTEREAG